MAGMRRELSILWLVIEEDYRKKGEFGGVEM
jgi:hypothetical protein